MKQRKKFTLEDDGASLEPMETIICGQDTTETTELGDETTGAIEQSIINHEFEENGHVYRPYTICVGQITTPPDEKTEQYTIKYCDVYLNDEIVETLHYNVLFNFIRKISNIVDSINFYISCPGGDMETLQVFLNVIEEAKENCLITCTVQGEASSAASVLALAGDVTYFGEFSYLMFHNISMSIHNQKEHGAIIRSMDTMKLIYEKMLRKYCSKVLTNKEIKSILEDGKEIYLVSDEARERYEKWAVEQEK